MAQVKRMNIRAASALAFASVLLTGPAVEPQVPDENSGIDRTLINEFGYKAAVASLCFSTFDPDAQLRCQENRVSISNEERAAWDTARPPLRRAVIKENRHWACQKIQSPECDNEDTPELTVAERAALAMYKRDTPDLPAVPVAFFQDLDIDLSLKLTPLFPSQREPRYWVTKKRGNIWDRPSCLEGDVWSSPCPEKQGKDRGGGIETPDLSGSWIGIDPDGVCRALYGTPTADGGCDYGRFSVGAGMAELHSVAVIKKEKDNETIGIRRMPNDGDWVVDRVEGGPVRWGRGKTIGDIIYAYGNDPGDQVFRFNADGEKVRVFNPPGFGEPDPEWARTGPDGRQPSPGGGYDGNTGGYDGDGPDSGPDNGGEVSPPDPDYTPRNPYGGGGGIR